MCDVCIIQWFFHLTGVSLLEDTFSFIYTSDGNPNYRFKMNPRYLAQFEAFCIFMKLRSVRDMDCSTKAQHNFNTVIAGKRFIMKESLSVLEF